MKYGIGITTRNRPAMLELTIEHFAAWVPTDHLIVVVDDNSTPENHARNVAACMDPRLNLRLWHSPGQLGIAKAKNACLWELRENRAQHFWLFDDDAFPAGPNWWRDWIDPGIDHLTYSMNVAATARGADRIGHVRPTEQRGNGWTGYTGCLGCCLYFSSRAIDILGGYDPRFGIYGYEHAQMTLRAHLAQLTPAKFPAPTNALDSVYSLDMHLGWLGIPPPLSPDFDPSLFDTSVSRIEADAHVNYAHLMENPPIYIPLENWK